MLLYRLSLSLATTVFFLFILLAGADAFQAKVIPQVITQGDAFVVKVTGLGKLAPPSASLGTRELNFAGCGDGCFMAFGAVDLDTKPGLYKILIASGKINIRLRLVIRRANFPTLNISLPEEKVSLSPEDNARAEQEASLLKSLWQNVTEPLWEGSFILPLGNTISTGFGVKRIFNGKKTSIHRGIDIKGQEGDEVRASNRGRVALVEELFFGGRTIVLDHGNGIFSVYMHLSVVNIRPDDLVSKGQVIGRVGSSGRASGPHLHYGVKVGDISANPLSLSRLGLQAAEK
ncbi:MAG: M23 family metallopeptidase [Nitrospirota bacterium]